MKNLVFAVVTILCATVGFGQAYDGAGDMKFQIGINAQTNGTGITGSLDYGIGQNFSIGATSTYMLGVNELINVPFVDKFDIKARVNANLGDVFQLADNADIYPGLNLSMKNFGGHLGGRYFFTDGFGVFVEFYTPIAKYNDELTPSEEFHNQFAINLGASFNF
ncbi:hypothetical protein JQC67_01775 [Aurantibacter crassamenti]|uniref:DUF6646 family protein n=1 Tax=Aurantibacter crassamenti TaxID=1837375 RepID=UPI00193A83A7|nr:DUF6646 family protein [Aurantibacter crassamenti]MBM1104855.1 hypothetical protein [Aurantibacter crassamenti]